MFSNNHVGAMSPLADPVISAIFASVEEAGLAAQSLISVILTEDNYTLAGKIVRITPQHYHIDPIKRGSRVDIEVQTDANERIIFEIQVHPDTSIMKRDLFSTSHILLETSTKGDSSSKMAASMPHVIAINILNFSIRNNHFDVVQPFKILYTKPPNDVAVPNFRGYNIQLPRLIEMKQNFHDPLYCWCYTLHAAHNHKKTIQEVLAMTPELQSFAQRDEGYQQFCDRYSRIAADPNTRNEYVKWVLALMRDEGMREAALEQGHREGHKEGIKEGIRSVAINMLLKNKPIGEIMEVTGLNYEEIIALKKV